MRRFYLITRDLHLYFGLFISPFVLVFSVSVFFLVHAWIPGVSRQPSVRTISDVALPEDAFTLNGKPQVDALRGVLDRIGVAGEINFVRKIARDRRLVVPVIIPGRETTVDLNFGTRTAMITQRNTGPWDSTVFLHKMPGPHNVAVRGNWLYVRIWKWLADASVYL